MRKVTSLGHVGIHVNDMPLMRDFYSRVLGLTVTGESEERGMVFLSANHEAEDHELLLMSGREAAPDVKLVQQISWHVDSIDVLREFNQIFNDENVTIDRISPSGPA